jgi:hypothetical protein
VAALCEELKKELFGRGTGGTSVLELETFLQLLQTFLHPHHTLCMLTKRNIVSLYTQRALKSVKREDFIRIKELCEESIEVRGGGLLYRVVR